MLTDIHVLVDIVAEYPDRSDGPFAVTLSSDSGLVRAVTQKDICILVEMANELSL